MKAIIIRASRGAQNTNIVHVNLSQGKFLWQTMRWHHKNNFIEMHLETNPRLVWDALLKSTPSAMIPTALQLQHCSKLEIVRSSCCQETL
eukprot:3020816-Amphidinium_carterae.1